MEKYCKIRLGEMSEIAVGHQLRKSVEPDPNGSHLLVQLGNAQDGKLDISTAPRMTLDSRKVRRNVKEGDILLRSRGASYGAVSAGRVPNNAVALAPLFTLQLMRDAPVSAEYLIWFLNCETTQAALKSCERGTYNPSVSVEDFKQLTIVVPPSAKQACIVEIDVLARNERALEQQLQAARDKQMTSILEQTVFGTR